MSTQKCGLGDLLSFCLFLCSQNSCNIFLVTCTPTIHPIDYGGGGRILAILSLNYIIYQIIWSIFNNKHPFSHCPAHARRPFADIEKSLKGYENESVSISKEALSRIRKKYEVEGNLTDCSADERYARRHQEIEPLIEAYFAWVKDTFNKVAPQSAIGKALAYSIYRENNIKRFLEDGNIPIDNSASLFTLYFYPHLFTQCA